MERKKKMIEHEITKRTRRKEVQLSHLGVGRKCV